MTRRGMSLIETMIAFFLLSFGILLTTQLFLYSLRYTRQVEARQRAVLVAERSLQKIRDWAAQSSGGQLNFHGNWAAYDGVTSVDPDEAEYQVHYEVQDAVLKAASQEFESLLPADQQGQMSSSARRVSVEVQWRGGSLKLATLVEEPPRRLRTGNALVVTGTPPNPVTLASPATFTVQAFDSNDLPIPDLEFAWYVDAMSTTGSVTPSNYGTSATFVPQVVLADGSTRPSPPGQCRLQVRAIYRGEEQTSLSAVMTVP